MCASESLQLKNEVFLPYVGQLIAQGKSVTIMVRGNSMNPFLLDRRDQVVIGPCHVDDLAVGDCVLARENSDAHMFLLHRVIALSDTYIMMQGDGNWTGTETCLRSEVIGKVTHVIRLGMTYPVDGKMWKRYSAVWAILTPMRRWLLAIYRRIPKKKLK